MAGAFALGFDLIVPQLQSYKSILVRDESGPPYAERIDIGLRQVARENRRSIGCDINLRVIVIQLTKVFKTRDRLDSGGQRGESV